MDTKRLSSRAREAKLALNFAEINVRLLARGSRPQAARLTPRIREHMARAAGVPATLTHRETGRTYRIVGERRDGVLEAEYLRDGTWRTVRNENTLVVLTAAATGQVPDTWCDSRTRALAVPQIMGLATELRA